VVNLRDKPLIVLLNQELLTIMEEEVKELLLDIKIDVHYITEIFALGISNLDVLFTIEFNLKILVFDQLLKDHASEFSELGHSTDFDFA